MATKDTHCRKCGSADVRRSNPHGILDLVMGAILKKRPYRCRSCRGRFFAPVDFLDTDSLDVGAPSAGPRPQGSGPNH